MALAPATIAQKLGASLQRVEAVWPSLVAGLDEFGVNSPLVQVAAAGTAMVEANFYPVRERRASQSRQPDLYALQERYWPSGFFGRGLVQTTWRENYEKTGQALGLDLVHNPDLLLEPRTAARALAWYFAARGIAPKANARDWRAVRVRVNGGTHGLDQFLSYVKALLPEVADGTL